MSSEDFYLQMMIDHCQFLSRMCPDVQDEGGGGILFSVPPILMSRELYITVTQQIGHGDRQHRSPLVTGHIH